MIRLIRRANIQQIRHLPRNLILALPLSTAQHLRALPGQAPEHFRTDRPRRLRVRHLRGEDYESAGVYLEKQENDLSVQIIKEEMAKPTRAKDQIVFWFHRFRKRNPKKLEHRRRLLRLLCQQKRHVSTVFSYWPAHGAKMERQDSPRRFVYFPSRFLQ